MKKNILQVIKQIKEDNINDVCVQSDIDKVYKRVLGQIDREDYSFQELDSFLLRQDNKLRCVKRYEDELSTENILCLVIKNIINNKFRVKFPNRNKIMRSLFNSMNSMNHLAHFTIIKFDFKDYFNSISSVYVYEKYIKDKLDDRTEIDIIEKFIYSTKYAYTGMQTSNIIAEIIGSKFDEEIKKYFIENGLIFYKRYIDDGFIILNEKLDEAKCLHILNIVLNNIFHDEEVYNKMNPLVKNKTCYNEEKCKVIIKDNLKINNKEVLEFLGYKFILEKVNIKNKDKIKVTYGISKTKLVKYEKRVLKILKLFEEKYINGILNEDYNDIELLRHRIDAFTSRTVYLSKKNNKNIWVVKGFISNYGELRYIIKAGLLENETENYLKYKIVDIFDSSQNGTPYFLNNSSKIDEVNRSYTLYNNIQKNKTLLFLENIGRDYISLVRLCRKIHIDTKDKAYDVLVREYVEKVIIVE